MTTASPARRPLALLGVASLAVVALAACTPNTQNTPAAGGGGSASSAGGPAAVRVSLKDDGCTAEPATVPSGTVAFTITNEGTTPNEFEVLAEDRLRILTEKENIGPGTTTTLTTALPEGDLFTACKPNMVGPLVGVTAFDVTPGEQVASQADLTAATASYEAYVQDQVEALSAATDEFAQAYRAGDLEEARRLYPLARQHYERIEPTAEAFGLKEPGDLDAALDARVQDLALEAGTEATDPEVLADWTGWHRIEADLFAGEEFAFPSAADRDAAVERLLADTKTLDDLVHHRVDGPGGQFSVTPEDVTGGAAALLEEAALSKITGEEETFSHTDLYDVQANLEGARVAYGTVSDIVEQKDPELARQIEAQFESTQEQLKALSDGTTDGDVLTFPSYDTIAAVQEDAGTAPEESAFTEEQRTLSDAVNGLSEPLSRVTGTVLS